MTKEEKEKLKRYEEIVSTVKSLEKDAINDGMEDVDLDLFALGEEIYYNIIKN